MTAPKIPARLALDINRISQGDIAGLVDAWVQVFGSEPDLDRPLNDLADELVVAVNATYGETHAPADTTRRRRWPPWLSPAISFVVGAVAMVIGAPIGTALLVGFLLGMLIWAPSVGIIRRVSGSHRVET